MSRIKYLLASTLCMTVGLWARPVENRGKLPYQNPNLSIEERVEDLIGRMTLEEKVYQISALRLGEGDEIFQTSGEYSMEDIRKQLGRHGVGYLSCPTTDMPAEKAVKTGNQIQKIAVEETRLGIPVIIDAEALHGCRALGATSYPQSIALSCTWNPALMAEIADAIGQETRDYSGTFACIGFSSRSSSWTHGGMLWGRPLFGCLFGSGVCQRSTEAWRSLCP